MEATEVRQYRDDSPVGGSAGDNVGQQLLATSSWQAVSIPANVRVKQSGSYISLTRNRHAQTAINVYTPHRRDELHCHPGSEHIFMVWQGHLTIRGINPGEEITLKPGELVHIKAGHYYQLCNDTEDILVLYQVATVPSKPSPVSRRSFRRRGDVTGDDLNDRGL